MKYIFVDIDGTISNPSKRLHLIEGEKKEFDRFHEESINDEPIQWVLDFVRRLNDKGYKIVFVSGRSKKFLDISYKWLDKYYGEDYNYRIELRPDDDYRPNSELKRGWVKDIGRDNLLLAIDDNPDVIKMYEEEGIPALLVPGGIGNEYEKINSSK